MGIEAEVGVPAPLSFTTPDGNATLGVRAFVQQLDGTEIGAVTVPHMARGRYTTPYTFAGVGVFLVDFVPYVDPTFAAEDVTYTRRTDIFDVRSDVDLASLATKTDISDLLTALEAALAPSTTYVNKMSTTFSTITGDQEVIVWAERNGQVTPGGGCAVAVKDALGVTKWTANLATPNADGVYRFLNPVSVVPDQNLYIVIAIVVDGGPRINLQPFYTVA